MPWRESTIMEERFRFVTRRLEGESMTALCREFGVSRKTGHKVFARYREHGLEALGDRPRTPGRNANRLPMPVEAQIVALKRDKPHWGARMARASSWPGGSGGGARCRRARPSTPCSTATAWSSTPAPGGRAPPARPCRSPVAPNDLWCTDFKGEFRLGDRRWCYPLTVTDQVSRYLLMCEALESTRQNPVITAFHRLFEERGLPAAIRSDNGVPFATPNGLYGLSALALWWLRLGIRIERIKPGRPQQNGAHERMHLTLKEATTRPAAENSLQQQGRFDSFREEFNDERPHEALGMQTPAEVYTPSPRAYAGLPELEYPLHDRDVVVEDCGAICLHNTRVAISKVLAGQRLGLREVENDVWLVSFMDYDLGYIDLEARGLQTIDNPFGARPAPVA